MEGQRMFRLSDLLAKAAYTWPQNPAVTCALRSLSWAELNDRCRRLATVLHGSGVGRGDRVAFLGFNSHVGVECYFAPALIGAAVVPINFRLSETELISCLNDCRPTVLIVDHAHTEIVGRLVQQGVPVGLVLFAGEGPVPEGMAGYEAALAKAGTPPDFDALAGGGQDLLVMFYTGGTTGEPKGVMLSHTNIFTNALGLMASWDMPPNEAHFITGPLFHTAGGARIFAALLLGTNLVLMQKFDIAEMLRVIETLRVQVVQFVPTMMAMLLDHPQIDQFDTSSIRLMTYGAAPMPPELLKRAMKQFPGVAFAQAFGMTEASPILTYLNPRDHVTTGPNAHRLRSIGRAAPFVDLRVIDEQGGQLPPGETGEIIARGPNIMLGYWEKPDLTATAMRKGWYHTGDGGYYDAEGYFYLAGRIKDMIITGGENVYPIEVENVLESHPAVRQVAVIGTPDTQWGERVHAIVQLRADAAATPQEIIEHCRAYLAHYKCPTLVSFQVDPLPLTKVNKIDKQALRVAYNGSA